MFDQALDELTARGVCEFIRAERTTQLRAEANIALAAAQWADIHGCEGCADGQLLNPHRPGSERARVFGADDNPEVLEFCVAELAAVLAQHPNAAVELIADVQDLRFRHPLLWARVQGLSVPLWKARQIVRKTRHLPRELAQLVDARTVDPVMSSAWARFLRILDAAIIAVDPELAEQLAATAAQRRFAAMGRPDESGAGLRTFTARTRASEVVWFDAVCGRIATMLKQLGDTDSLEVRRATAFGLLGHPVRVLQLFADYQAAVAEGRIDAGDQVDPWIDHPAAADGNTDHLDAGGGEDGAREGELDLFGTQPSSAGAGPADPVDPADPADAAGDLGAVGDCDDVPVGEGDVHPAQNDAGDPDVPCPACAGAGTLDPRVAGDPTPFVKLATGLDKLDWARLLPKVTFYVHASRACFTGQAPGVVRVEGHGPLTADQARDFFGRDSHHISVKPVIDPDQVRAVDAYETPEWMAEVVHLLSPGDVAPYASYVGRGVDLDHLNEYLDPTHGGPPGQTHPDNLAPMIRFTHRLKTHGRWRIRVVRPQVLIWRTPNGFFFQVDPRGTHPLTDEAGQLLWDACAGNTETTGTGTLTSADLDAMAAQAQETAPTRAGPHLGREPNPGRAGPSRIELEFFTILDHYEYELSND